MDPEALEAALRAFLSEELGLDGEEVERGEELLSTGLIDSVDLVKVAEFLEARVGISIPDRDIGAHHFDSIAAMLDYVSPRRRG